jgi:chemotaxis protein MotC
VSPALRLALPVLALAAALAPALGQEAPREPAEIVRSLHTLQDRIAHGSTDAHLSQRALLAQIAEQLALARPEAWKDARNARAAVAFVLSGGDPRLLRRLAGQGALAGMDEALVQGAMAYGESRNAEAADLLGRIDARSLDPSIAGHVALVQAELVAAKSPKKALAFLDDARLLSPGTLVEEAALRRQIAIVATAKDLDRFDMLSTNYLRRFAKSVYAGSFRRQFAADVAGREDAGNASRTARLAAALEALDPADCRDIYLAIAREALIKGKVELTRFAADSTVRLVEEASAERRRASLYAAAVLVVTEDFDKGVSALEAMDRGGLDEEDAELLDAARSVAAEVRRQPVPNDAPSRVRGEDAATTVQIAETARQTMARADRLIETASK